MKHEQALRSFASLLTVTNRQGTAEKQNEEENLNKENGLKRRSSCCNERNGGGIIRSSSRHDERTEAGGVVEEAERVLGISNKEHRKIVVKIVRDERRKSGGCGPIRNNNDVKMEEEEKAEDTTERSNSTKDDEAQGSSKRRVSQSGTVASSPMIRAFLSSFPSNGFTYTLPHLCILPIEAAARATRNSPQQCDGENATVSEQEQPAESNLHLKQPQDRQQRCRGTDRKELPAELIKENCDESISKAVLRNLIKKGNPFPPQGSYNKGKKKLQKRRRSSHRSSITARNNMAAAAAAAAAAFDDDDGDDAPTLTQAPIRVALPTKMEQMVSNLAHPLHYSSSPTFSDIATASHLLNANLGRSMQSLIDDRIKYYFTKLVRKSIIKEKGFINSHASRILAHDIGCFDLSDQGSMGFVEREKSPSFTAGSVALKGCVTSFNVPKDVDPEITSRVVPCGDHEDEDSDQELSTSSSPLEEKNKIEAGSDSEKNTHGKTQNLQNNDCKNVDENTCASNICNGSSHMTSKSAVNNGIANSILSHNLAIEKNVGSPREPKVKHEEGDADAAGGGSQASVIASEDRNISDGTDRSTTGADKNKAKIVERDIGNCKEDDGTSSDTPHYDVASDGRNKTTVKTVVDVVLPLTFAAIVDVEIGVAGRNSNAFYVSLEFGAPGSIKGTFKRSSSNCSLMSATINLDTKSLFNSMIQQAKLAIRKVISMAGPVSKEPSELGHLLASKPTARYNPLPNGRNSTTSPTGTSTARPTAGRMQRSNSLQQSSTVACTDPAHAEEMIRRASLASTGNSCGLGLPTTFTEVAVANRRRRSSLLSTNSRRDSISSTVSAQRASFTAAPPGSTRALGEGSSCAKSEHAEEMIRRASMMSSMAVDEPTRFCEESHATFTAGSCPKAARAEEIIRRNSALSGDPDDNSSTKEQVGSCPKARQAELLLRRASMVSSLDGDEGDDDDEVTASGFSTEKVERSTCQGSSLAGSKRRLSRTLNNLKEEEKTSTKPVSKLSRRNSTQSSMPTHLDNIPTKLWNLPAKSRRVSESVVQSSLEIARLSGDVGNISGGAMPLNGVLHGNDFKSTVNDKTTKNFSPSTTPSIGVLCDNGLLQHGGANQMSAVSTAGGAMDIPEQTLTPSLSMRRRSSSGLLQPGGAQMAAAAAAAVAGSAGNILNSGLFQPNAAPIETPEQIAVTGLAARRRSSRAQMAAAAAAAAASVAESSVPEGASGSVLGCGLLQPNMAEQVATIQAQNIAQLGLMGAMGGLAGATATPGLPQSNTVMLQQLQAAQVQAQVQQQVQVAQVAAAVRRNSYRRVSFDREALGPLLSAFADEQEEG